MKIKKDVSRKKFPFFFSNSNLGPHRSNSKSGPIVGYAALKWKI